VSRRNSILLAVVGVVAVVGAYWMLVLSPQREKATSLDKQIAAKQTALASAQAEVSEYEKARANYRANYSTVARLGKAVPADDDVRSLLVQVNSAAGHSKVDFRTINVGTGSGGAPAADANAKGASASTPPPGATTVGTAGFSTMPFTLDFKGSYFELGKFFNRLDRFVAVRNGNVDVTGRLLLLNTITITPDTAKGFPTLAAEVSANSYLLPPTEGLTAGATATGPAGTTGAPAPAASATPAPSNPATTTTATITGAAR
jgi:hypothetical protein